MSENSSNAKNLLMQHAKRILKVSDISELTADQVTTIFEMECRTMPSSLSIDIEETRPTRQQFANNRWSAGLSIDLSELMTYIKDRIKNSSDPIEEYVNMNKMMSMFISMKYNNAEALLKELLREAEAKDGIGPVSGSRFED